tara:strand:+ start:690 stop:1358 length:669 start_codon:yes stop_codon:yes gene_type:complete
MSDNQANPVEGAETDLQNAAKSIEGLLTPSQEPVNKEQVSSEPKKEELSQDNQPQEQEKMETETEAPAEEEVSEEVSQDENAESQIQEQDSTYKVKVAGQEFDVTLDELRAGYSRDADYRRKTEELASDRKSLQSETEQQRQDYSQRLSELNQLVSLTQEQLNSEFKNLDLEKLYEEDPTEAARLEHKMRKKQEKLAESIQRVKAEQQKQFQQVVSDQQKIW